LLYLENILGNSSIAEVVPLLFERCRDADRSGIAVAGCSVSHRGAFPEIMQQKFRFEKQNAQESVTNIFFFFLAKLSEK